MHIMLLPGHSGIKIELTSSNQGDSTNIQKLKTASNIILSLVRVCVCFCTHAMRRPKNNFVELILTFHLYIDSWD